MFRFDECSQVINMGNCVEDVQETLPNCPRSLPEKSKESFGTEKSKPNGLCPGPPESGLGKGCLALERSDEAHLDWAAREGRVLYSFNMQDFCRLHSEYSSSGKTHAGIIVAQQQRYRDR